MAKRKSKAKVEAGGVVAEADPRRELIKEEIHKLALAINELDIQIDKAETAKVNLVVMKETFELGLKHTPEQTQYSFAEAATVDATDPANDPFVQFEE